MDSSVPDTPALSGPPFTTPELEPRLYRMVVERSTGFGVLTLDPQGRILTSNIGVHRICGYMPEEIIGHHFSLLFRPEDRERGMPEKELERAGQGEVSPDDNWIMRKDGSVFWASGATSALRGEDGALLGFAKMVRDASDRKRIEEALLASEKRFREAISQVKDYAIFSTDRKGVIVNWNEGCKQVLGYDRDEFVGMDAARLFTPEDIAMGIPEKELAIARTDGAASNDRWMRRRSGEQFWASGITTRQLDDNGNIIGFTKVLRDNTERHQAALDMAAALARQQVISDELKLVFEGSPHALVMLRQDGSILIANTKTEDLFGYPREALIGQPFVRLFPDRFREIHAAGLQEALRAPLENFPLEHREVTGRRADGGEFSLEAWMTAAATTEGIFVVAALVDITERKAIEVALRESERRFRFLYELGERTRSLIDPVEMMSVISTQLGTHLEVSRCAYADVDSAGLRFTVRDDFRRDVPTSAGEYELSQLGKPMVDALARGETVVIRNIETEDIGEVARTTFRSIQLKALICCPLLKRGRLVALMAVHQAQPCDWTENEIKLVETVVERSWSSIERARVEQKLRQAQQALQQHAENLETTVAERTARLRETVAELERFSYSLSHDMRAPLRAMQGFSQVLLEEYASKLDEPAQEYLQRIANASARLDQLIRDVLSYTMVMRGQVVLKTIEIEPLVRQLIAENPDFQPPKSRIEIQTPLLPVRGHEAYLTQCLSNLLANAVKFVTPDVQPQVRVRTEVEGEDVKLLIEDNGIGIPPESLARIFEMFERMHPTSSYEGTGIGLAIVRKAAERMGGQVGATSQPGRGSTFWIRLKRG